MEKASAFVLVVSSSAEDFDDDAALLKKVKKTKKPVVVLSNKSDLSSCKYDFQVKSALDFDEMDENLKFFESGTESIGWRKSFEWLTTKITQS